MEMRKDPITMSWVLFEEGGGVDLQDDPCPLCPGAEGSTSPPIYSFPYDNPNWQVRVIPHLHPLYRIEGDAMRRAEGIYDKMRNLGAHEIVIETPEHHLPLSRQSDENVAQVVCAWVARIADLKRDGRFRYVTVLRNQGAGAGQDLSHSHSEITAMPFIPRRIGYELRAAKRYYELKERCMFCDSIRQEISQQDRTVDSDDHFVSFCPFASRVPYETWVIPIYHHSHFEEDLTSFDGQLRLARFLKGILQRLEAVTPAYHLVLHTSPNTTAHNDVAERWTTLSEDYHWHFEILPVLASKSKSYSLKEVYYNPLLPEEAARELRALAVPVHS